MKLEQAIDIMNQMKNSYDKTVSRNIGDESFLNQINAISKAIELILANIEPDCKHKNAWWHILIHKQDKKLGRIILPNLHNNKNRS